MTKVRITGGEPLVRKGVPYLISQINAIPGIDDIGLTTNGIFLGEHLAELKEAGLKRVNISLDTMKKDRFAFITGVDAFDKVLASIKMSVAAGLTPVKINAVIIEGFNDDEVLDFAKLAKTRRIEVRFIEFMPFGAEDLWHGSRIITSEEIQTKISTKYELHPSKERHRGPARMFDIKGGLGRIGFISPVSSHICHQCNRIRLTSGGGIRPCLFSDEEFDVKTMLRNGASDEEIAALVRGTVEAKPERKAEMSQIKKCQKSLRHIGG